MSRSNTAPAVILRGVNNEAGRALSVVLDALPQHCPICPLFAERGDSTEPLLVSGSSAIRSFGAKTFSYREKFATHQTVLFNVVNEQGNAAFIQRLIPEGARKASLRLSLEIVPSDIPVYLRNDDGTYKLDADGLKQKDGANVVTGYRSRWLVTVVDTFGEGAKKAGTLRPLDPGASVTSDIYPIMDFEADFGLYGENVGIRISAPTVKTPEPLDLNDLESVGSYLYRLQFVERTTKTSTPIVTPNNNEERYVDFSLDPLAYNDETRRKVDFDTAVAGYYTKATGIVPADEAPFKRSKLYSDNVNTVLALIAAAENAHTGDDTDDKMFNLVSGLDAYGIHYHTFEVMGPMDGGVALTDTSTHYALDGADGDMSAEAYDTAVAEFFNNWENHPAQLMNSERFPISDVWDSGFTLKTKESLKVPMGLRKDIITNLATQDVSRDPNTASEDSSIGIALRTSLAMHPESTYFGTSVVRAAVVPRCGKLVNSEYTGLLPLTIELAHKVARYMGASNGRYKTGEAFDVGSKREVEIMEEINVLYTNPAVRNKDWSNGLMYVQSMGRNGAIFPAFPSSFADKTSTLSSYFVARAVAELEKVAQRAWLTHTGSSLPRDTFIERSNQTILDLTANRFDGRYIIVPDTYFTDYDEAAGYSYSCNINLYANNSLYLGKFAINARRMEDLNNG